MRLVTFLMLLSFRRAQPWNVAPKRISRAAIPMRALRVTIHIRGRGRGGGDAWIEEAYEQYEERLRPQGLDLVTVWHKTDEQLTAAALKETSPKICLDVLGKAYDSLAFGEMCFKKLEEGGSRLCFVIGGAEGLPAELRPGSGGPGLQYFSLSKLTFTHQMARVLLAEQIYRASEIRRGSAYHKE